MSSSFHDIKHKSVTTMTSPVNAIDLLDECIANLEAKLGLAPGASIAKKQEEEPKKQSKPKQAARAPAPKATKTEDQPEICKLEFKVGVITNVWVHPDADKLYCEEIDIGEETPRQIASGLRPHFTLEEMLGQRLLVVSNLKAKNLVGFKSHGMVLCAAMPKEDGSELVEFVEPPAGAVIGEVVTFAGLPVPEPWSAAQVDKKKVFAACMDGMKTTVACEGAWNGHVFTTSAGPCKAKTIAGGVMR
jgi:aminoacyl tRNA synthase complex-interacting multifunctional protein 1